MKVLWFIASKGHRFLSMCISLLYKSITSFPLLGERVTVRGLHFFNRQSNAVYRSDTLLFFTAI